MYKQVGPQVPNLDSIESTANFMAAAARFNPRHGIKRLGQQEESNSLGRILADQRAPTDRTGLGYAPKPVASQEKPSGIVSSIPYRDKDGWHVPPITREALEESARIAMAPPQSQAHADDWGDGCGPALPNNWDDGWDSTPALKSDWDEDWGSAPAVKIENSTSAANVQKSGSRVIPKPGLGTGSYGFPLAAPSSWYDAPGPSTSRGNWGTTVDSPYDPKVNQSRRYIAPHLRQKFVSAGTQPGQPGPTGAASTSRQNPSTAHVEKASLPVSTSTAQPMPLAHTPAKRPSSERLAILPLKAENISPDLTTYRIPRPDMNFHGSENSAPASVSTIDISDTGVQELPGTRDVRNCIALERDVFVDRQGKFYQTNWAKAFHHRDNDDEYFDTEHYLTPFVTTWVQGVPDDVRPRFLRDEVPDHWKSDVDTNTGLLVEPVHFPDTIIGDNSALTGEEDWRRRNWSSNLLIHRRFAEQHKYKKKKGLKAQERQLAYKPGKVEEYVKPEPQPKDEVTAMTPYDRGVPKIPAFLRPAEVVDMRAVSQIYEAEMKSGFQVVDSEPPTADDWETVLRTSREFSMPFIVAVYGSARGLRLKEGNLQWSDEPQVPYNEQDAARQGVVKGQILGFAYASVWQPGIAGSGQGTSRYTARLHVWVDPKHRRNKLGFCLLDKLLAFMSPPHIPRTGIDFIDIHNNPIYHKLQDDDLKGTPMEELKKEEARRNRPRKYYNVQISYKFKHRPRWQLNNPTRHPALKDYVKDLDWVKKLLEEKLPFIKLVTFEAVHQSSKLREPEEEDGNKKVFWLDEFVWEYYCTSGLPDSDDGF
ncbi:hypothetical protein QC761_702690 [Podospora bellae-mahoneyi]|uniref:N-acetyltransferase domain-containing protein n=1 Tax=Podospora bellae-mahoneyi TaxID=2093777 RepID=A0ABR0F523_9PEZI|nr:hypothetical protein QC761_702690 [Podospora bellae-mahoneyi]